MSMVHKLLSMNFNISILILLLAFVRISAQNNESEISLDTLDCSKVNNKDEQIKCIDQGYRLGFKSYIKKPDRTFEMAKELLAISKNINYDLGIAKSKQLIGRVSMFKKSDSVSFKLAEEALAFAQEIEADTVYLDCINVLGFGHYKNKQLHKVFEYNTMGLDFAKKINNWDKTYTFTVNAASIFMEINEYEKALDYFNQALELLKEKKDSFKLAQLYVNMSSAYWKKENLGKAQKYLNLAIKIPELNNSEILLGQAYTLRGEIAFKNGSTELAEQYYNEALEILSATKSNLRIVDAAVGLSKIESSRAHYNQALKIASNALKMAKDSNYFQGVLTLNQLLHEINSNLNRFELASQFLVNYTTLNDSLKIAQNNHKFRIELTELSLVKEKEILQLRIDKNESRQKMIIGLSVFAVGILGGIIFFVRRNERKYRSMNIKLNKSKTELENQSKLLLEANRTKEKLFAIIGHDLKAPIQSFQGLLRLFNSGDINQTELVSFIPKLRTDIDYISFTLNNLLSWGKTQMSGSVTNPNEVLVKQIVTENINLLSEVAEHKSINLFNEVNEDVLVWCDRNHLSIVIRNLLNNALKFTAEKGAIKVRASEKKTFWEISVSDTGIGMNDEMINNIFSQEHNTSNHGTNNEKGTGLGLVLCKEMVEKNNGSIWVESNLNEGSCFYFSVPKSKNNE